MSYNYFGNMMVFKVEKRSSTLSPFVIFNVNDGNGSISYIIEEVRISSLWRRLMKYTKFRMVMPLNLEIKDTKTGLRYQLSREHAFKSDSYILKRADGDIVITFERKKLRWIVSLSFYRDIRDGYGNLIGSINSRNPLIIGPQRSEINDSSGSIIATFVWKEYSFFKGFTKCDINLYRNEEKWIIISIVAAIIRGLILDQR